jgi:hypothetical protein
MTTKPQGARAWFTDYLYCRDEPEPEDGRPRRKRARLVRLTNGKTERER